MTWAIREETPNDTRVISLYQSCDTPSTNNPNPMHKEVISRMTFDIRRDFVNQDYLQQIRCFSINDTSGVKLELPQKENQSCLQAVLKDQTDREVLGTYLGWCNCSDLDGRDIYQERFSPSASHQESDSSQTISGGSYRLQPPCTVRITAFETIPGSGVSPITDAETKEDHWTWADVCPEVRPTLRSGDLESPSQSSSKNHSEKFMRIETSRGSKDSTLHKKFTIEQLSGWLDDNKIYVRCQGQIPTSEGWEDVHIATLNNGSAFRPNGDQLKIMEDNPGNLSAWFLANRQAASESFNLKDQPLIKKRMRFKQETDETFKFEDGSKLRVTPVVAWEEQTGKWTPTFEIDRYGSRLSLDQQAEQQKDLEAILSQRPDKTFTESFLDDAANISASEQSTGRGPFYSKLLRAVNADMESMIDSIHKHNEDVNEQRRRAVAVAEAAANAKVTPLPKVSTDDGALQISDEPEHSLSK